MVNKLAAWAKKAWRSIYRHTHSIKAIILRDLHWEVNYILSPVNKLDQRSKSGVGSSLEQTTSIRSEIPRIIKEYSIKSVVDAPCGDAKWIGTLELDIMQYIGLDISRVIIAENKKRSETFRMAKLISFGQRDLRKQPLPEADLVICRDLLVHLSLADCKSVIKMITSSKSKYLLATSFPDTQENTEIATGSWRPINLSIEPFTLTKPIEVIEENRSNWSGSKQLCLYDLRFEHS